MKLTTLKIIKSRLLIVDLPRLVREIQKKVNHAWIPRIKRGTSDVEAETSLKLIKSRLPIVDVPRLVREIQKKVNHAWIPRIKRGTSDVRADPSLKIIICCCLLMTGCQKDIPYKTTGYVEGNLIYLSTPQGGYLQNVFVSIGQKVKKGQLLLKLNPQPQLSNVEVANAKLQAAQENLNELQKNKDNVAKYKINIAKSEVDEALANLRANK